MNIWEIIGAVIMIFVAVGICIFVLLQEGTKGGGMAALTGGGDSFLGKNEDRSKPARLYRATRFCAILFIVVTIAVHAAGTYL